MNGRTSSRIFSRPFGTSGVRIGVVGESLSLSTTSNLSRSTPRMVMELKTLQRDLPAYTDSGDSVPSHGGITRATWRVARHGPIRENPGPSRDLEYNRWMPTLN
jgi:hypothetical protein